MTGPTPTLADLGLRLRRLGQHRLAADLFDLAGMLVSETPVLDFLGELVARVERAEQLTTAALAAVADLERMGPADRPALVALRAAVRCP